VCVVCEVGGLWWCAVLELVLSTCNDYVGSLSRFFPDLWGLGPRFLPSLLRPHASGLCCIYDMVDVDGWWRDDSNFSCEAVMVDGVMCSLLHR
jgi:hypothetical protein